MRTELGSFFWSRRTSLLAGVAVAAMLSGSLAGVAQDATPAATQTAPAATSPTDATITNAKPKKKPRVAKEDQVKQSKDTKAANKTESKANVIVAKDAQLPDKQLYDK